MAAMIGTRNDEDLVKMLDARSNYGLSLRRDYFKPKSELDSPTGWCYSFLSFIYCCLPSPLLFSSPTVLYCSSPPPLFSIVLLLPHCSLLFFSSPSIILPLFSPLLSPSFLFYSTILFLLHSYFLPVPPLHRAPDPETDPHIPKVDVRPLPGVLLRLKGEHRERERKRE
jgi:hypothetical protein